MRAPRLLGFLRTAVVLAGCHLVLAGCQTSAPAAARAQQASPQSIAIRPGDIPAPPQGWTTPASPEPAKRLQTSNTVYVLGFPIEVPQSVIDQTENGRDSRVGDATERRTRVGSLRGRPGEWILTYQSSYQWGTGLDGGSGDAPDLFTNRFRLSHEISTPLFGRVGMFADYVNRQYNFSGANDFITGTDDPWGSVHRVALGVNMFQPVSESWAIFLATGVRWHAEDGADLSDGFSWNVTVGGGYRVSDTLDLGAGVVVSDSFGGEIFVIGGPQFDWRPNERWRIFLSGTELEIQNNLSRSWQVALAGGFLGHRFRLNDRGPLPNGIAAESRFPIWGQVRYRGVADLDMTLRVGVDISREFRVEDASGNTLRTFTTDPSPFVSFRAILRL